MIIEPNFIISRETYEKCKKFAEESVATSIDKYAHRNQLNAGKISQDIRNGKIAEQEVYNKIIPFLPGLTEPDYNIYEKNNKSWDPDLKDNSSNIKIAVKSQDITSSQLYGESYVFQIGNGKYDCDTGIFGKDIDPNHYVALVQLNVAKRTGFIRGIVKVQWLHEKKLFKPMQKQNLQNNKLAVYNENLEQYKDELWQL